MKLMREGGAILAARLGQAGLTALCGLLAARALGPAGQGLYALGVTVVLFVAATANGGLGLAAVPDLRAGRVPLGRMLRAQAVWIAAVVAALAAVGWFAWQAGLDAVAARHLGWTGRIALYALLGAGALLAFDILFYDLLARGRLLTGPLANLARAALHLGLLAALLLGGRLSLGAALLAWAGAQAAAALACGMRLARLARSDAPEDTPAEPTPRLVGRTLRAGWLGQLSAVASLLHLRLDLALVAAWHGPEVVGIYTVAVMVGELLWLLPGALQPLLVYASADADDTDRDVVAARAVRVGLAAAAVAALVLALVSRPLLSALFGAEYLASTAPLRALLPGIVIFAAGSVLAGDFIGRGRPAWNAQASGVTVAVNVLAGLLLIPSGGATGAAWASTIAYAAGALVMLTRFRAATGLGWRAILGPRSDDFSLNR